jgi:hypothetical protein
MTVAVGGSDAKGTIVGPTPANVTDRAQVRFEVDGVAAEHATRAMRKPRKLWKVGELAQHAGISRQAIHNYVLLGLIEEAERSPGGHRLFDDEVFARLQKIERLKRKGLRLTEIVALLNQPRTTRRRKGPESERGEQPGDKGESGAVEQE